ncbi:hypothetical protein [Pseudomonas amygdali]|nr:hypothetical protein [Pseudomonas amygdali]
MAHANYTATPVSQGLNTFPLASAFPSELEKISCSVRDKTRVHPLFLMGKRVRLAELMLVDVELFGSYAYESSIAVCTVLAVSLGSPEHGIETRLLLQDDSCDDRYYSDIGNLTILEVLD